MNRRQDSLALTSVESANLSMGSHAFIYLLRSSPAIKRLKSSKKLTILPLPSNYTLTVTSSLCILSFISLR